MPATREVDLALFHPHDRHRYSMSKRQAVAELLAFVVTGGGTLYSVWQTAAMSPPPAPAPVLWLLATTVTTAATLSAYIFTGPDPHPLRAAEWRERQRRRAQTAIE